MGQQREKTIRDIMFVGLDNAGKTTLIKQMVGEIGLHQTIPTFGYAGYVYMHRVTQACRRRYYKLNLVDLSGHEALRAQWGHYYDTSLGYVFVFDAADERRLPEALTAFQDVLQRSGDKSILICGNKQDQDCIIKTQSDFLKYFNISSNSRLKFVSTIGTEYNNNGVSEGFNWILNKVLNIKSSSVFKIRQNISKQHRFAHLNSKQKLILLEELRVKNDLLEAQEKRMAAQNGYSGIKSGLSEHKENQTDDDHIIRVSQSQELQHSHEIKSMYSSTSQVAKGADKNDQKQMKVLKKLPPLEHNGENDTDNDDYTQQNVIIHTGMVLQDQILKKKRAKGVLENIDKIHVAQ